MNNIMWNYLDKRSATISALKDYNDMCFILENHQEQSQLIRQNMSGISSPKASFSPNPANFGNTSENSY